MRLGGGIAALGESRRVMVNGMTYTLPNVIGLAPVYGSNPPRYTVWTAGGGSVVVDWIDGAPAPPPAQVPAPPPAQAPAQGPAQGPGQYLPAGWATRNASADIEAATAPVAQARDFESFGAGAPVLKDTTPSSSSSSSSSASSSSSSAGLGLLGLLAFFFWS